jgi:hypothetical protein
MGGFFFKHYYYLVSISFVKIFSLHIPIHYASSREELWDDALHSKRLLSCDRGIVTSGWQVYARCVGRKVLYLLFPH